MTRLNKDTQKAQDLVWNYRKSRTIELWHCYDKPSYRKQRIFENLKQRMHDDNGRAYCIPTYNSQMFTFAYIRGNDENRELVYITAYNEYVISLD